MCTWSTEIPGINRRSQQRCAHAPNAASWQLYEPGVAISGRDASTLWRPVCVTGAVASRHEHEVRSTLRWTRNVVSEVTHGTHITVVPLQHRWLPYGCRVHAEISPSRTPVIDEMRKQREHRPDSPPVGENQQRLPNELFQRHPITWPGGITITTYIHLLLSDRG